MGWEPLNIILLSILIIVVAVNIGFLLYRVAAYSSSNQPPLSLAAYSPSFSVSTLSALAARRDDMKEQFKSFYDMKYQNMAFIIKGLGGAITLFATPFIEKLVTNEKTFNTTDYQLLAIIGVLLVILVVLASGLRKIVQEFGETLRIYYSYRP